MRETPVEFAAKRGFYQAAELTLWLHLNWGEGQIHTPQLRIFNPTKELVGRVIWRSLFGRRAATFSDILASKRHQFQNSLNFLDCIPCSFIQSGFILNTTT
jgi:hypothetical protein